jgi:sulfite oxidase
LTGGGRGIERVDISTDGGKSWFGAHRYQKEGVPYVAGDISSDKWAWVLFEAVVNVNSDTEIVAKAVYLFLIPFPYQFYNNFVRLNCS